MPWIKKLLIIAFALITGAYIFVFSLSNNQLVDINLLFITLPQLRIELVVIVCLVTGGLLGLLASLGLWLSLRKKYRIMLYKANRQQEMRVGKV